MGEILLILGEAFFTKKIKEFSFFQNIFGEMAKIRPPPPNHCIVHKIQKEVEWDLEGNKLEVKCQVTSQNAAKRRTRNTIRVKPTPSE